MSDQAAIVARLEEECAKYGLPVDLDVLLRHIYANRDLAFELERRTADTYKARLEARNAGLPAILSIVEERRNAHRPKNHLMRYEDETCEECDLPWPCDERKALDKIHHHLTGGTTERRGEPKTVRQRLNAIIAKAQDVRCCYRMSEAHEAAREMQAEAVAILDALNTARVTIEGDGYLGHPHTKYRLIPDPQEPSDAA